jgi:hypothetical protein
MKNICIALSVVPLMLALVRADPPASQPVADASRLMEAVSGLARTDVPATQPASTSSKPAEKGGLQVTVIAERPKAIDGEPLTIRVEMKNTLPRTVRLYTNTSEWSWRFQPPGAKGYWTLSQRFAEGRVWSGAIEAGKSSAKSFTTRSARGPEYVFEWVGDEKKPRRERVFLPVGRYSLTIGMTLSTYSRPGDAPEPWEGELVTSAVDFEVVEAFQTQCQKKEDRVKALVELYRAVLTITSPGGIGKATVERKGETWPDEVRLRLHLRGLESLVIECGAAAISAQVHARDGGFTTDLRLTRNGKDAAAAGTEIRAFDAKGNPAKGLPGEGGCFEIVLPKAMLEAKTLKVEWIDFYRG